MEIKAIKTLSNVAGVALYDVNDEAALVGFNSGKPVNCPVQYDENGEPYIEFYGKHYLNEFCKVA